MTSTGNAANSDSHLINPLPLGATEADSQPQAHNMTDACVTEDLTNATAPAQRQLIISEAEYQEFLAFRQFKAASDAFAQIQASSANKGGSTPPAQVAHAQDEDEQRLTAIVQKIMQREKEAVSKPLFTPGGPFVSSILDQVLPPGVYLPPNLGTFSGRDSEKPEDHLERYTSCLGGITQNEALWCRFFGGTLAGNAMAWFRELPAKSIANFEQLSNLFMKQFADGIGTADSKRALADVKQRFNESLREYWSRFNQERRKHLNFPEHEAVANFRSGTQNKRLRELIAEETPITLAKLNKVVSRVINAEENKGHEVSLVNLSQTRKRKRPFIP